MSDELASEGTVGRRTYLKAVVATGLATSLAGCLGSFGPYEGSIVGLDHMWAQEFGHVNADHRRRAVTYTAPSFLVGGGEITGVSHAVAYSTAETEDEPTTGFGTVSFPSINPNALIGEQNPYVDMPIRELLQSENSRLVLKGLGVKVGANVEWVEGPTREPQQAGSMTVMGSSVEEYALIHGVVRTNGTYRAVMLAVARAKNDDEALLVGSALQQVVEAGDDLASFRQENRDTALDNFAGSNENLKVIDPGIDLAGFN